jgi:hypothetical protein
MKSQPPSILAAIPNTLMFCPEGDQTDIPNFRSPLKVVSPANIFAPSSWRQ